MTSPVHPHAPVTASFEEFPAREYLDKYYAGVGSENAAFLDALTYYTSQLRPLCDAVVEVGGGPVVLPLLALTAAAGRPPARIVFGDLAAGNLDEVRRWLRAEPSAFDYRAAVEWLEGSTRVDGRALVESLRATRWDVRRLDLRETLPAELVGAFDTVSSHFCAESVTSDAAEFVEYLGQIRRVAAPGATLLLSFITRSSGYGVAGNHYPAVYVDPENLPRYLAQAGLDLEQFRLHAVPTEGPVSETGYEGLMFVAGRLAT